MCRKIGRHLLLKTIEHLKRPCMASGELLNSFVTNSGFWRLKQEKPGAKPVSVKGESRVSEKSKPLEFWKPDVALRRMGGDIELLSSMVDYFLEDSPTLLAELQQLVHDGNSAEAARVAHSLKGLCANFEAADATQAGSEMESVCMSGMLSDAEQLLPQLTEKFAKLSRELGDWQDQQVS